jgi:hypothetical protein
MPFPVVEGAGYTEVGTIATSHPVDVPAGVLEDELLVLIAALDNNAVVMSGLPAGWSEIARGLHSASGVQVNVWRKVATGGEGDFSYTTGSSRRSENACLRISGSTGAIADSAVSEGAASTAPNPSSLTPSWGLDDDLWIALYAANQGVNASAFPANYSDNQHTDFVTALSIGVATRDLSASSENPGAFTIGSAGAWVAFTLAIRGAPSPFVPQVARY